MNASQRPWVRTGIFLTATILAVVIAGWWRTRNSVDAAWLLQALPEDGAVHFVASLDGLRAGGFLGVLSDKDASSDKALEDPDYVRFVKDTGFDYRRDLGTVAAAFKEGNLYIAAQGRFDFQKLGDYARAQGGACVTAVCQMPASQPGRNISFVQLRPGVLALAVSTQPLPVSALQPGKWNTPPRVTAPVWISAPGSTFADVAMLPSGTHAFLSPLRKAQRAVFTLGPGSAPGIELRLEAATASTAAAGDIVTQLTATTDLLRKMLTRDKLTPSAADLTGILTSGRFETRGSEARGVWSIDKGFIETLLAGKVR